MNHITERMTLEKFKIVEFCTFENFPIWNQCGGAISGSDLGTCVLKNLLFYNCSAKQGGAVAINNSLIYLYSSCFSLCSAREKKENGGNSFLTFECSLAVDLMSSFRCAPDKIYCGDAVFEVRSSKVNAVHTNFSSCNGNTGECSFGSIETNTSRVSYMNVVDCYEHSMYLLSGSDLEYANFIRNVLYGYFINGNFGKINIYNSYFFENNNNLHDGAVGRNSVQYFNCFGDVSRNGVTNIIKIITFKQTKIIYQKCQFESCEITEHYCLCIGFVSIVIGIIGSHKL